MSTELIALIDKSFKEIREGSIVIGRIIEIQPQVVLVDIGYKSEGAIPISEFEDEDIEVGNDIEVLLERLENDEGMVVLSKEKAAHKQNWDKYPNTHWVIKPHHHPQHRVDKRLREEISTDELYKLIFHQPRKPTERENLYLFICFSRGFFPSYIFS